MPHTATQRELQSGSTSVVYAGLDVLSGTRVALKCMRQRPGDAALTAFQRELRLGSCGILSTHQSVARMLDGFVEGTMMVLVVGAQSACEPACCHPSLATAMRMPYAVDLMQHTQAEGPGMQSGLQSLACWREKERGLALDVLLVPW